MIACELGVIHWGYVRSRPAAVRPFEGCCLIPSSAGYQHSFHIHLFSSTGVCTALSRLSSAEEKDLVDETAGYRHVGGKKVNWCGGGSSETLLTIRSSCIKVITDVGAFIGARKIFGFCEDLKGLRRSEVHFLANELGLEKRG